MLDCASIGAAVKGAAFVLKLAPHKTAPAKSVAERNVLIKTSKVVRATTWEWQRSVQIFPARADLRLPNSGNYPPNCYVACLNDPLRLQ